MWNSFAYHFSLVAFFLPPFSHLYVLYFPWISSVILRFVNIASGTEFGGFRCNDNTIHLQCQACGGMMPSRPNTTIPQHCNILPLFILNRDNHLSSISHLIFGDEAIICFCLVSTLRICLNV